MMSACLITEIPDFPPPERTPPFLIASSASPALDVIHIVRGNTFEVSANVRSEDAPNNEQPNEGRVIYKLLIDYGQSFEPYPYAAVASSNTLDPASFDQLDRRVTAKWLGQSNPLSGCHTFTLIASHEFFQDTIVGCPSDLDDSSQLTWRVFVCDSTNCAPGMDVSCPVEDPPPTPCYCPSEPTFNPIEEPLCDGEP